MAAYGAAAPTAFAAGSTGASLNFRGADETFARATAPDVAALRAGEQAARAAPLQHRFEPYDFNGGTTLVI